MFSQSSKRTLWLSELATIVDWFIWGLCVFFFVANVLDQASTMSETALVGIALFAVLVRIRIILRAIRIDALKRSPD